MNICIYCKYYIESFSVKKLSNKRKQNLSVEAATAEILRMLEEDSESDSDDLDELYDDNESWSIRFLDILQPLLLTR